MKKINRRRIESAIDAALTILSIAGIIVVVCFAGYIIGVFA